MNVVNLAITGQLTYFLISYVASSKALEKEGASGYFCNSGDIESADGEYRLNINYNNRTASQVASVINFVTTVAAIALNIYVCVMIFKCNCITIYDFAPAIILDCVCKQLILKVNRMYQEKVQLDCASALQRASYL